MPAKTPPASAPRELAKQEFARRLAKAIQDRDWNQSDLARAAALPREIISTYIRAKSYPTAKSLRRIADALGVTVEVLSPGGAGLVAQDEVPSFSVHESPGHHGRVWLRVNRMVPIAIALKIGALLEGAGE